MHFRMRRRCDDLQYVAAVSVSTILLSSFAAVFLSRVSAFDGDGSGDRLIAGAGRRCESLAVCLETRPLIVHVLNECFTPISACYCAHCCR